jgi:hypothetical protein
MITIYYDASLYSGTQQNVMTFSLSTTQTTSADQGHGLHCTILKFPLELMVTSRLTSPFQIFSMVGFNSKTIYTDQSIYMYSY